MDWLCENCGQEFPGRTEYLKHFMSVDRNPNGPTTLACRSSAMSIWPVDGTVQSCLWEVPELVEIKTNGAPKTPTDSETLRHYKNRLRGQDFFYGIK